MCNSNIFFLVNAIVSNKSAWKTWQQLFSQLHQREQSRHARAQRTAKHEMRALYAQDYSLYPVSGI